MTSPHVAFAFGTRPEAIKLAPVILEAQKRGWPVSICVSGQQDDMTLQALKVFALEPTSNGHVMQQNQSLTDITTRSLSFFSHEWARRRPDFVVVQGDTAATLTGALASFYSRIPVAHVEAGLRSFRKDAPFPEELNRRMVSSIADIHFAPTPRAVECLQRENHAPESIKCVGNTVMDAFLWTRNHTMSARADQILKKSKDHKLVLFTIHRRENLDHSLETLFHSILTCVEENPSLFIYFPVHPRPVIRDTAERILGQHPRIQLDIPTDYATMAHLLNSCFCVVTDSGGLQEEALCAGKPVLICREVTERPEVIENGNGLIVGTDGTTMKIRLSELLEPRSSLHQKMSASGNNVFGSGDASKKILDHIFENFKKERT